MKRIIWSNPRNHSGKLSIPIELDRAETDRGCNIDMLLVSADGREPLDLPLVQSIEIYGFIIRLQHVGSQERHVEAHHAMPR